MILSTHAVTGAAVASLFPQSVPLAFTIAFASHFVLDAIPHKDYSLDSIFGGNGVKRRSVFDFSRVIIDASIGLLVGLFIFWYIYPVPFMIVLMGILGAVLPDALQFLYIKTSSRLLLPLHKFHKKVHVDGELQVSTAKGLFLQFVFLSLVVSSIIWFFF